MLMFQLAKAAAPVARRNGSRLNATKPPSLLELL